MPTNEELQQELHAMRAELGQLRTALTAQAVAEEPNRVLSRRNLLRAAPMVAVGGAIAAMSASPAAASPGNPLILGASNSAASLTTTLSGGTDSIPALAVEGGVTATDLAVSDDFKSMTISDDFQDGARISGIPLEGQGAAFTVIGYVQPGGMEANGWDAVLVEGRGGGNGVTVNWDDLGDSEPQPHSPGSAIQLTTNTCDGVTIDTEAGQAIVANVTSAIADLDAVTITYAGTSRAFYAESTSATNINGTITGVNDGHGVGLWGEQRNNTGSGFGVVGVGGSQGRGARLSGGAAALQLLPSSAATHPTTGKAGDFFVDHSTRLWFCTKASSGATPAVWKQLA